MGGTFPATTFEAYDSTGGVTSTATAAGMQVNWRTASLTNGNRTFTGARSFLQSHPSYSWQVRVNNITGTNNAEILIPQSNFNNGTTTFGGAGSSAGTALPSDLIPFGGNNPVTFTSTGPFWNNGTLGQDDIAVRFTRPSDVFSADSATPNQVVNQNFARTGQPTFQYPVFYFTNASSALDDSTLVTNFTGGSTTQATSTSKTRTIGNLSGIDFNNNTGSTQYIWVAYPTGSPDIARVDVRTRRGTADATNTLTLDPLQVSTTDLTFQPTGGPSSAAENYKWFWIEVPNGDRATLGSTS